MTAFLQILALASYLAAALMLGQNLAQGVRANPTYRRIGLGLGALALVLHAVALQQSVFTPEGVWLGFFNVLSLTAWLISLLLVLTAAVRPVESLGIVIFPFAAAAVMLKLLFPEAGIRIGGHGPALELHILVSFLAYSLLGLAAVQALLLAAQERHLRTKRPGGYVRALPPLQTMEQLLFQLIALGFFLLSLALASGFLFLEDIFAQHLVHKTVLSITAWTVFGILLFGRWRFGWRGRTAIRWTLSGFAVLMLAYFGSKLVLELILRRGAA
ncbi:cytochrome c biogenesis protein CcsA [Ectothiorhodospiraceae bacterium 2226]|nr:cytochrome c biogenesis protein CcsA [Ectothiorhodospiraceae bacterium 2226]